MMNILAGYYNETVLKPGHAYSESGTYYQIDTENDHSVNNYIPSLVYLKKDNFADVDFQYLMLSSFGNRTKEEEFVFLSAMNLRIQVSSRSKY